MAYDEYAAQLTNTSMGGIFPEFTRSETADANDLTDVKLERSRAKNSNDSTPIVLSCSETFSAFESLALRAVRTKKTSGCAFAILKAVYEPRTPFPPVIKTVLVGV